MIRRWLAMLVGAGLTAGVSAAMAFGVGGQGGVFTPAGASQPDGDLLADVTGPLFDVDALRPSEPVERCITLTNTSATESQFGIFGRRDPDALASHLRLRVTRGTRPATTPGSCAGFVPSDGDYGYGATGVEYDGTLASFPASADDAIVKEGRVGAGESRTYRLSVELTEHNDTVQGLSSVQAFVFAASDSGQTRPPSDPGSRKRPRRVNPFDDTPGLSDRWCARVDVPDVQAAGLRRIPGTRDRWVVARRMVSPHRRSGRAAPLALRIWTNRGGRQLVLALGEKALMGVAPPREWGTVTYRINRDAEGRGDARPYVWQVDPERVYPGENRVEVTIRPRRGTPITTEFRFKMRAWGEDQDESICTLA